MGGELAGGGIGAGGGVMPAGHYGLTLTKERLGADGQVVDAHPVQRCEAVRVQGLYVALILDNQRRRVLWRRVSG